MKKLTASKNPVAACLVLMMAAGTATTASAIDRSWTCNSNSTWNSVACWSPAGVPAATDNVNIGNVLGVQNTSVFLDVNETINDLDITDGMTLDTNAHTLNVSLAIDIGGRNTVGSDSFPSRLVVDQIVAGAEVSTQVLTVHDGAEVVLVGGGLDIDSSFTIAPDSYLRGSGTVLLQSNSTNFRNDGGIVTSSGGITFTQIGTGRYDLDGSSGGGDLTLTAVSNSILTFNGDGLAEPFGGTLSMIRGTLLQMNLDEAWTVEASGDFDIYGAGSGAPARVAGAPLTFNGTMSLYGGSQFELESDVTFGASSELVTGTNAAAHIEGVAVVNGGLFIINEGSNLFFDAVTTLHGGTFMTHSDESTTGSVDFNGSTNWDGNVSVIGYARQNGPARVSGPTVITGDTFDMDGSNAANWDIDFNLTLNVDRLDYSGSRFNNTLDIGAGRLNVNLTNPADYWGVAGTMNLSGNNILFSNKVGAGSPLWIEGTVNVSGKVDISTGTIVYSSSTINIPAAASALRFMGVSLIGADVTFTGAGILQNGGVGTMTLNSGLNTNGVGLNNTGLLRVGGIVSVDRFQNSGTWNVDIGGHNPGTQYDRIISNGPVTLGGTLEVDLVDAGLGLFHPVVGDQFTILNAGGGISGSFAPNVTSTVGSTTYHWDVIVSSADVVLRLASIDSACAADFNDDGFVNSQDFFDFLAVFFAGAPASDFNADGALNSQDFFDFLTAFFAGC